MRNHAADFAGLVEQLTTEYADKSDRYGIIAAAYDTEICRGTGGLRAWTGCEKCCAI